MAHPTTYNKAPPLLAETATYEDWKKKINIWNKISTLDAQSKASQVFLSLSGEAEQAILELDEDQIYCAAGLQNILDRLDRLYKKDETLQKFEWLEKFESYNRSEDMTILQHIVKFEQLYNKCTKYGSTISDDLLAFKLLKSAKLSPANEKLAKATGEMKFDAMKAQLKKIFTENADMSLQAGVSNIKIEDVNYNSSSTEEEALFVRQRGFGGARPRTAGPFQQQQQQQQQFQRSSTPQPQNQLQMQNRQQFSTRRGRNPLDNQGRTMTCHFCNSVNHLYNACPDRQSGVPNRTFSLEQCQYEDTVDCMPVETEQSIILFQSDYDHPNKLGGLLSQSWNSAVLDCGASRTCAGYIWFITYKSSLPESEKSKIVISRSDNVYRFGDGVRVEARYNAKLPAIVGPKKAIIDADILDRDIPLLLSKQSMKNAQMTLHFSSDSVDVFGVNVPLNVTDSGHYTLPICPSAKLLQRVNRDEAVVLSMSVCTGVPVPQQGSFSSTASSQQVVSVLLTVPDPMNKTAVATKLHVSFAHATSAQMLRLLKSAGEPWCNDKELHKALENVIDNCETCLAYKKAPPRPVVGLPLATRFLQSVGMDLKFYRQKIILHLVDHATRLSMAVFIPNKVASTVVKAILQHWVAVYGATDQFFSDNGGEFINKEFVELCERFNIDVKTTGAEAPWSNGLVERHHVLITHMLDKVLYESKCDIGLALAWCVNAKNSLQNVHGFSPFQLALGQNPKLPSALSNRPPALATSQPASEVLRANLNALHAARTAFIEKEHSERVYRALSHNVRTTNNNRFINGDTVYYKRSDSPEWKGPATVLGQDGQQILLKHGGFLQRVHTCRVRAAKPRVVVEIPPDTQAGKDASCATMKQPARQQPDDSDSDDDVGVPQDPPPVPVPMVQPETEHPGPSAAAEAQPAETELNVAHVAATQYDNLLLADIEHDVFDTADEKPTLLSDLRPGDFVKFTVPGNAEHKIAKLRSLGGKRKGKYKNTWNIQLLSGPSVLNFDTDVHTWELLHIDQENFDEVICNEILIASRHDEIAAAKAKELASWIDREVSVPVDDEGQQAISVKWVVTEKMIDGAMGVKARLVARGFEEVKDFRTDSPTLSREGMRVTLAIIAANGWLLQSIDIKTAFLQGKPLERTVFLKPPKEANTDRLWKLLKCVYGLGDAPRQFYLKLFDELIKLGMVVSTVDKALFFAFKNNVLIGIIGCHVDDMLYGGDDDFKILMVKLREVLIISTEQSDAFKYVGISLKQNPDLSISINQDNFASSIKLIELSGERTGEKQSAITEAEKSEMRSVIGQLNWLSGITRPDLSFDVCQFSTKVANATVADLFQLNKVVYRARKDSGTVVFPCLKMESFNIK